jgi:aryl-alcohol dehydrogenase-like predicted oxidoreductase
MMKSQISLWFCISHTACHTAIPGAKTSKQVAENCKSSDLGLLHLDEIPTINGTD